MHPLSFLLKTNVKGVHSDHRSLTAGDLRVHPPCIYSNRDVIARAKAQTRSSKCYKDTAGSSFLRDFVWHFCGVHNTEKLEELNKRILTFYIYRLLTKDFSMQ